MSDISDRNPPDNNHYKKPLQHEASASVERPLEASGSCHRETTLPNTLKYARQVVGSHYVCQEGNWRQQGHRYLPEADRPEHWHLTEKTENKWAHAHSTGDYFEYHHETDSEYLIRGHCVDPFEQSAHVIPEAPHEREQGVGQSKDTCHETNAPTVPSATIQYHEPLDVLVEKMTPMIRLTARRLKAQSRIPMHVDMEDLIQAGTVGLIEASQRFNPRQGAAFETYAIKRIQGAMVDELRSSDWLPRSLRRHAREAEQIHTRLEQYYGGPIRERDVAAVMEVPLNTYNRHRNDVHNCQLLDYTDYDLETFLPEEEVEPLDRLLSDELHGLLQLAIASLDDEREREALVLYRLSGNSLRMIGERMGVSDSRVCQLHKRAMAKIRAWFKQYFPELEYMGIQGHGDFPSDTCDQPITYRTYSYKGGPLPPRDD